MQVDPERLCLEQWRRRGGRGVPRGGFTEALMEGGSPVELFIFTPWTWVGFLRGEAQHGYHDALVETTPST